MILIGVKLRLHSSFFKVKLLEVEYLFTRTEKRRLKVRKSGGGGGGRPNHVPPRLLFQYIHIMLQTDNRHYEAYQPNTFNQRIFSDVLLQSRYLPTIPKPWKHVHYCIQKQYICYQNYQSSEITGGKINHISSFCQLILIQLVIKQNLFKVG